MPTSSPETLQQSSEHAINALGPQIPFIPSRAFYPIRPDLKGAHYPFRVCSGQIIFGKCVFGKWSAKEENLFWEDVEMMKWLKSNDFGLCKRPSL